MILAIIFLVAMVWASVAQMAWERNMVPKRPFEVWLPAAIFEITAIALAILALR